jgi:hypothetical protein
MATASYDPWGKRYDPYSSPITFDDQSCGERIVMTFPEVTSPLPSHEIGRRVSDPKASLPSASGSSDGSTSSDIKDLKHRLEHIKISREKQREHTLGIQRELEDMERAMMAAESSGAHKSKGVLTTKAATERVDSPIEGSSDRACIVSWLNPKRMFCSMHKVQDKPQSPTQRRKSTSSQRMHRTSPTVDVDRHMQPAPIPLDSIAGRGWQDPEERVDAKFSRSRAEDENRMPKTCSQLRAPDFDPYHSRLTTDSVVFESGFRSHGLLSERETYCLRDSAAAKTCLPNRFPAWYERPDKIATDSSDQSRVMQMVFYPTKKSFDGPQRARQTFQC